MPQLVPFYFVNQVVFTFVILIFMIYIISKYVLPRNSRLFNSRNIVNFK